ncbi:hypothetical protein BZA77DRAFT_346381 [Pyronema omphalodes]|nr:hypothetical protein BZA77DRAFT_346381 [Pyronema omphalodes]
MAPRSRRQAAARAQPAGNAYGVLYDDYESHSDVHASAEELISALDGYTPSPCTQCFKSTTAMVALSAAMREMRGVLERFEKSASPRIDLMLLDNTMAVEAINEHLDVLTASSQDMKHTTTKNLFTIATGLDSISQMTENNVHSTEELKEAWRISRAEIAALKDVVAGLAKQISELKATTLRPPSPTADTTISSAVEEMSYKSWMLSGGSVGCDSTEVDGVGKERDKEVPGTASPERTGPQDRTAGGSG